jgi:hypothetical protein
VQQGARIPATRHSELCQGIPRPHVRLTLHHSVQGYPQGLRRGEWGWREGRGGREREREEGREERRKRRKYINLITLQLDIPAFDWPGAPFPTLKSPSFASPLSFLYIFFIIIYKSIFSFFFLLLPPSFPIPLYLISFDNQKVSFGGQRGSEQERGREVSR